MKNTDREITAEEIENVKNDIALWVESKNEKMIESAKKAGLFVYVCDEVPGLMFVTRLNFSSYK